VFPAQSRTAAAPLLVAVYDTISWPPKSAHKFGTVCSHRIHYLQFASDLKLPDPLLEKAPPCMCQLVAAMYAVHVGSGSNLFSPQIRLNTVKHYVNDMASLVGMATAYRDTRKDNPTYPKVGRILTSVHNELKRYETVPN